MKDPFDMLGQLKLPIELSFDIHQNWMCSVKGLCLHRSPFKISISGRGKTATDAASDLVRRLSDPKSDGVPSVFRDGAYIPILIIGVL